MRRTRGLSAAALAGTLAVAKATSAETRHERRPMGLHGTRCVPLEDFRHAHRKKRRPAPANSVTNNGAVSSEGRSPGSIEAASIDSGERNHRFGAAISPGPTLMFFELGDDGHYDEKMALGLSLRFEYAYQLVRGFELGGDLSLWFLQHTGDTYGVVIPALLVRPYLPLGDAESVELGLDAHVGGAAFGPMSGGAATWTGWGVSAGPDVRSWLWPRGALQLGLELSLAHGHNSDANQSYYQRESGWFGALGFWLALLSRF